MHNAAGKTIVNVRLLNAQQKSKPAKNNHCNERERVIIVSSDAENEELFDYLDNGELSNAMFPLGSLEGPPEVKQTDMFEPRMRRFDSPGFIALRGKKQQPFNQWLDFSVPNKYDIEKERPRRLGAKSFVGFRGKRMGDYNDDYNWLLNRIHSAALKLSQDEQDREYAKRRMQFHAMRGRR
ncbi:hypothetical protein ScPMuIL_011901 [Solemya velum]